MNSRIFFALLILQAAAGAALGSDLFPDDHGNTAAAATALTAVSNRLTGTLDYPADKDFFSVAVLPQRSILIQIETGTVWDVVLSWTPPGGHPPILETNTLWTLESLACTQDVAAAASTWTLELGAAFEYTTGTYHLAVWMPADEDVDADGVADSWEQANFGGLTANLALDHDMDGLSSLEEYRLQTQPTNAFSTLRLADVQRGGMTDVLSWDSAPYAAYTLSSAGQLEGPWTNLDYTVAGSVPARLSWTNQAAPSHTIFYRLQFQY